MQNSKFNVFFLAFKLNLVKILTHLIKIKDHLRRGKNSSNNLPLIPRQISQSKSKFPEDVPRRWILRIQFNRPNHMFLDIFQLLHTCLDSIQVGIGIKQDRIPLVDGKIVVVLLQCFMDVLKSLPDQLILFRTIHIHSGALKQRPSKSPLHLRTRLIECL